MISLLLKIFKGKQMNVQACLIHWFMETFISHVSLLNLSKQYVYRSCCRPSLLLSFILFEINMQFFLMITDSCCFFVKCAKAMLSKKWNDSRYFIFFLLIHDTSVKNFTSSYNIDKSWLMMTFVNLFFVLRNTLNSKTVCFYWLKFT